MALTFFDGYTCIGPRRAKHPAHGWRLADVLDDLQQCSIAGALVCHQLSVNYDPMYGNHLLLQELDRRANLFPAWNVMPHHAGDFPAPDELRKLLRAHDVRAVTISPATNGWDMLSPGNRPLLGMLERERVVTIIRRDQMGGYRDLEGLLARYPELPILLMHASWTDQRYVVPLLQAHENLHIGLSHYQVHYGLETLAEAGLAERLLYASNAPKMSMGAHRTYIDYADLPEDTRAKIAGGNLARLLQAPLPETPAVNPLEDAFMRAAREGQPQPAPIFDMHVHILHEGLQGAGGSYVMRDGDPQGVYPLMKKLGYAAAGIMSWSVVSGDAVGGNAAVQQALDFFPENYWGLGSFDPTHYAQDEIAQQMATLYADRRFLGVKPYPVFGVRYDDPLYAPMWEFANERRLYALIHRVAADFSELEALAPRYPRITWVVAHCGSDFATADGVIACMRKHANVYAELTLTPVPAGIVEYLVAAVGEDRVLYGSDLPMRDPRQQLGWVVYARLNETAKAKILGGNARRIIDACRQGMAPRVSNAK
ncbi:MAG: amidohydrolase family protein [Armatimonadota bacterium]